MFDILVLHGRQLKQSQEEASVDASGSDATDLVSVKTRKRERKRGQVKEGGQ